MELASLLAGERFGDHPPGVCPVLRGFLQTYNDAVDDRRRQDLSPDLIERPAIGAAG